MIRLVLASAGGPRDNGESRLSPVLSAHDRDPWVVPATRASARRRRQEAGINPSRGRFPLPGRGCGSGRLRQECTGVDAAFAPHTCWGAVAGLVLGGGGG